MQFISMFLFLYVVFPLTLSIALSIVLSLLSLSAPTYLPRQAARSKEMVVSSYGPVNRMCLTSPSPSPAPIHSDNMDTFNSCRSEVHLL